MKHSCAQETVRESSKSYDQKKNEQEIKCSN